MEYKNLNKTPVKIIHSAFIDAFSEYEVKIDMPIANFQEMLKTRSFSAELSIGCFDSNRLAGFVLTGYRLINNKKVCYDIATGIIKEYQNKKIGSQLIAEIVNMVQKNNSTLFQLEVLEHNIAAQAIYKKNGFAISRKFKCYSLDLADKETTDSSDFILNIPDSFFLHANIREYLSFDPGWQNSIESYLNSKEKHAAIGLLRNDQIIGYGIVHKKTGSVLQFGIQQEYRHKNIEYLLLSFIAQSINKKHLRFLNVEENSYEDQLLESYGAKVDVNQFEMVYVNHTPVTHSVSY